VKRTRCPLYATETFVRGALRKVAGARESERPFFESDFNLRGVNAWQISVQHKLSSLLANIHGW
jgi:hypothetical protein